MYVYLYIYCVYLYSVISTLFSVDNTVNYVATLAFFCGISCVTIMLKFGGFKASLNIFNSRKNGKEKTELHQGSYMTGAYRTNRDDVSGKKSFSIINKKPSHRNRIFNILATGMPLFPVMYFITFFRIRQHSVAHENIIPSNGEATGTKTLLSADHTTH